MCTGVRPAMNELMAIMNHESHNNPLAGDVFLLKLLFNLYEECDIIKSDDRNRNQDVNTTTSTFGTPDQIGIRLEDIVEAVSCASCSVEEQMKMNKLGNKIVQYFFDSFKKKDLSFDRPLAKSKSQNDNLERELKGNATELRNVGLRSGKLTYNYYGEVAKTAVLKSKRESDAVKFGFPLPYSHLSHLGSTNINMDTDTDRDRDTIAKKNGARSFDTDGDDSVTSQSLFLGGRSEWSEHSFHQGNLGNERENNMHRLTFDYEIESEDAYNQGLKDLKAEKFLSYPRLRSIKKYPKISQNELINCICNIYPEVLEEFSDQTKKFRCNFILSTTTFFKINYYISIHNS